MKQVYCLYRVFTVQQLREDDIPMQRQACREFAVTHQWGIIKELYEKGISGFKTPIQDRKVLQQIKKNAELRKFDILLVFMFDRLGRRDSETPFFVEDLSMYGVEIWSVTKGQQRFESHADKLINYIRYWQASGERLKTSERIKTRMGQLTMEGFFCGGRCAYGYQLIKTGRKSNRGHEIHDLIVQSDEAAVIQKVFDYRIRYGYGSRKIASVLEEESIYNRNGKKFHFSSIRGILEREQYTGRLVWGDRRSDHLPELKIISAETFAAAQHITQLRKEHQIPQKITGQVLLPEMSTALTAEGKCLRPPLGKVIIHVLKSLSVFQSINATTERSIKGSVAAPLPTVLRRLMSIFRKNSGSIFGCYKLLPQIHKLAKEWTQFELPVQKMMIGQIIDRVEISSYSDIEIAFLKPAHDRLKDQS